VLLRERERKREGGERETGRDRETGRQIILSKQVLRSTILSSTIVSFFFDNARRGRF
jgi:hypothetical protein